MIWNAIKFGTRGFMQMSLYFFTFKILLNLRGKLFEGKDWVGRGSSISSLEF